MIIKGFPENEIKYKLRVRDDFKDIGTEEKDIEAMMEKSKNYKKKQDNHPIWGMYYFSAGRISKRTF